MVHFSISCVCDGKSKEIKSQRNFRELENWKANKGNHMGLPLRGNDKNEDWCG